MADTAQPSQPGQAQAAPQQQSAQQQPAVSSGQTQAHKPAAPTRPLAQPQQQSTAPAQQPAQAQPTAMPAQPAAAKPKAKKPKKSLLSSLLPGSKGSSGDKKSTKAGTSTQKFLKIKGIRNGILELQDGSFKAIIMASSVNFALMSGDEQKAMLYGYQEFLNSLEFPIQITVQSRIINIGNYLEKLNEAERMQENDLMKIQIGEYREYIKSLVELANITTNRYYVVISYTGSPGSSGKESMGDRVKQFINPAREAKVEIESYDKAIQELNLRISRVTQGLRSMGIRAANLNTQEVVELFYTIYNPELSGSQVLAELERLNIDTE